jgi:hypothetical protein
MAAAGAIIERQYRGRKHAAPILVMGLGLLVSSSAAVAADAEADVSDADVFEAYCADYYSLAQCDGALLFMRRAFGARYIASLNVNDDPQSYLASLREVIEGGRQMPPMQAPAVTIAHRH